MKTYTEKEVEILLAYQRKNCFDALDGQVKNIKTLKSVLDAKEPKDWREQKEYFIIFNGIFMIDISQLPGISEKEIKDIFQEIRIQPLLEPAKEIKTEVEISKETAEFLKNNCNIERNNYGEDIYILNNLRFKIEER